MTPPRPLAKVVIGPPTDAQVAELLKSPDEWPIGHAAAEAILRADHALASVSDEILRDWFDSMAAQGLGLELEVGAVKPWSCRGARTFEIEAPIWRRFIGLGAPLISITMDEPWGAGRALDMADRDVASETADFVFLVRRDFPALWIGDVEPYPIFPRRQHEQWIEDLHVALQQRGAGPLDFYRIDPNWAAYDAFDGSWSEVVLLEQACRGAGLSFSLIYWAADRRKEHEGSATTHETWSAQVVRQAKAALAAGGTPDQIVLQSWVGEPLTALPETDFESFAGSLCGVLQQQKSSPEVRHHLNYTSRGL